MAFPIALSLACPPSPASSQIGVPYSHLLFYAVFGNEQGVSLAQTSSVAESPPEDLKAKFN